MVFVGKDIKLPSLKYQVTTLQDILHTCFVLICQQRDYYEILRKLLFKLLAVKNTNLIKTTFII